MKCCAPVIDNYSGHTNPVGKNMQVAFLQSLLPIFIIKVEKMETLIIKIEVPEKAKLLEQLLKSMDFVSSVDYIENYVEAKRLFEEINQFTANTELSKLTMDDIIAEVKQYRNEKKLHRN